MDPVSEAFLALHFKTAFLEKKGTEFQDWFAKLASNAHGADFEIVRPYGNQGDWKCDGRMVSTGTVFQWGLVNFRVGFFSVPGAV